MNIRVISEVISDLGEGPLWDHQNNSVTWTDITKKIFHTADLNTGVTQSTKSPSMIGALAHTQGGELLAATQEGFALIGANSSFTPLHSFLADDMRMNDGKVDPVGRMWAGSMATSFESHRGSLYVLERDGTYRIVLKNITLSNGMGWSPSGEFFYYIDSIPGVLRKFDYEPVRGELSNPIDLITFDTSMGIPDGMTVTSEGEIVVALWDGGRLEVYLPSGEKISEINLGVSRPTSCTFGGLDEKTLIVTSASQGIDRSAEPMAGRTLAITGLGISGLPAYKYG